MGFQKTIVCVLLLTVVFAQPADGFFDRLLKRVIEDKAKKAVSDFLEDAGKTAVEVAIRAPVAIAGFADGAERLLGAVGRQMVDGAKEAGGLLHNQLLMSNRPSDVVEDERCSPNDRHIDAHFNRSNWMHNLGVAIEKKRLLDVAMPGSHQSATYSIVSVADFIAVCQNTRLTQQLNGGVRYLDLRPGDYSGVPGIRIGHGNLWGSPFESHLLPIAKFLEIHPKEFVILNVGETWVLGNPNQLSGKQKTSLVGMLGEHFGPYMVKSTDEWFHLDNVTMGDLWRHDKRILVLLNSRFLNRSEHQPDGNPDISRADAARMGLWPKDEMIKGKWGNTDDARDLVQVIGDDLRKAQPGQEYANVLHKSELIFTPQKDSCIQAGVVSIVSSKPINGDHSCNVNALTRRLQASNQLRSFVAKPGRMNIVTMDFIFGASPSLHRKQMDIVDAIINRNRRA